jgi:hypothetical protein
MALEKYLNPGEEIIFEQRKHWNEKLWIFFVFLTGVVLTPVYGIGLLVLLAFLHAVFTYVGATYAITNRRTIAVTGLFSRNVAELSLEQAHAIHVQQPIWLRLFGCGHLVFNPANAGDFQASSLFIDNICNPHHFRRLILEQREQLAQERVGMAASLMAAVTSGGRAELPAPPSAIPQALPPAEPAWCFASNGDRRRPVPARELQCLVRARRLTRQDWVWKDGMTEWVPADKVNGLL